MLKNIYYRIVLLCFAFVVICGLLCSCNEKNVPENGVGDTVLSVNGDSTYVYNIYGIAQYKYNDNGKLVEIISLDPITLTPFISDSEKYECKYKYSDSGYISELVYFGKDYYIDAVDENGRPVSAVCDTVEPVRSVNFKYDNNNNVVFEEFLEGDTVVFTSKFNSLGKPTQLDYPGNGKINFTYSDSETYVDISLYDPTQTTPDITISFDEAGYPKYLMQSMDGAMSGTTWYYNEEMLCIDTLIESSYDGSRYTEEYEINHNKDRSISDISYYIPDINSEPVLYSTSKYEYDANGTPKKQIDVIYNGDDLIDERTVYEFVNGKRAKTTTEKFKDGLLESKDVTEKEFDNVGREKTVATYNYDKNESFVSGMVQNYVFDFEGYVTERKTEKYSKQDVIENIIIENYEFDDNKNKTKATYRVFDKDNVLVDKEIDTFEYDANGNITVQTVSDYDEKELLVSVTKTENKYDANGTQVSSTVTLYDTNGNVISTETK